MKTVKLRKVGNSFGFTIPKELVEKYNLKEGEELHVFEKAEGFTITPYNPEFENWAKAFDKTDRKYKNVLNELSK